MARQRWIYEYPFAPSSSPETEENIKESEIPCAQPPQDAAQRVMILKRQLKEWRRIPERQTIIEEYFHPKRK
jgi:hypothetical protein